MICSFGLSKIIAISTDISPFFFHDFFLMLRQHASLLGSFLDHNKVLQEREHHAYHTYIQFIYLVTTIIITGWFYIRLFSAQTHGACDSEWVTVAFHSTVFNIHWSGVLNTLHNVVFWPSNPGHGRHPILYMAHCCFLDIQTCDFHSPCPT